MVEIERPGSSVSKESKPELFAANPAPSDSERASTPVNCVYFNIVRSVLKDRCFVLRTAMTFITFVDGILKTDHFFLTLEHCKDFINL